MTRRTRDLRAHADRSFTLLQLGAGLAMVPMMLGEMVERLIRRTYADLPQPALRVAEGAFERFRRGREMDP